MLMNWKFLRILLGISISVLLLSMIYAAVTFFRLRQLPEPERVYVVPENPSITLRDNPQEWKTRKSPDESSKIVPEISLVDVPLPEDEGEANSEASGFPRRVCG